jgi:putative oxidoreductase
MAGCCSTEDYCLIFHRKPKPINMKSPLAARLAEIIFALCMGFFGVLHFMHVDEMSSLIPDFIPGDGKLWIYITGTGLIAAALAIVFKTFKTPACYLLALMLLVFVFTIHLQPALDGNPGSLLKDTALAMAAIMIGNRSLKLK